MWKNPYQTAKDGFISGKLDRHAALGLLITDRDFKAEAELGGHDVVECGRALIEGVWTVSAIHHITGRNVRLC